MSPNSAWQQKEGPLLRIRADFSNDVLEASGMFTAVYVAIYRMEPEVFRVLYCMMVMEY